MESIDKQKLQAAALAISEGNALEGPEADEAMIAFEDLATPSAVLALLAESDGLLAQHHRDSAELRRLCQARDDARKERDQLKVENKLRVRQLEVATAEVARLLRQVEPITGAARTAGPYWISPEQPPSENIQVIVLRDAGAVGNPAHPGHRTGRWLERSNWNGRSFVCDLLSTGRVIGWVPASELLLFGGAEGCANG